MKEITWRSDSDGMLVGARAHDSNLISLEFIDRDRFVLSLKRVDGTMVELSYKGVQEISVGHIWEGSIVTEIFIWSVGNVPHSSAVDVGWNALLHARTYPNEIDTKVKNIVGRDNLQFLSIIGFAHGTSTALVCKSLRISEPLTSV